MNGVHGKKEGSKKGDAGVSRQRTDSEVNKQGSEEVKDNVGEVVAQGIETEEVVVNGVGNPPEWPIGDFVSP